MIILALYIPKPEELILSIVLLAIAFFVLCAIALWMKLSLRWAALLMALGGIIAITPDVWDALPVNLGPYGEMARQRSNTSFSDAFFWVTSYLHVGRGRLVAFGGMAIALLIYAAVVKFRQRWTLCHDESLQGPA